MPSIVRTRAIVYTEDFNGRVYRLSWAYGVRWSTYYGQEGGGFGTLTFQIDRPIGPDYRDVGFGYKVRVIKGIAKLLFKGIITGIEETQRRDRESIIVTAVGMVSVFSYDVYNKVYRDARTGQWATDENESGSFVPKLFDVDLNERLYLKPRRSVDFETNDFTRVRYDIPFAGVVKKITFDYDLALPAAWPGKLEVRDDNGSLWSLTATASGSKVLHASAGATYFAVRFYCTSAGENTAADDTVYGELTNVKVYGHAGNKVTMSDVAGDLVVYLEDHGICRDVTRILDIGRELPDTVVFEDDKTPTDILKWACAFGDSDDALLAWGVQLNDLDRFYLERQDLSVVKYYVRRRSGLEAQVKGDLAKSQQKLYPVYRDDYGQVQRGDDQEDLDQIADLGGFYRRAPLDLTGTFTSTKADELVALALSEQSLPEVTTSFTVTDHVYDGTGKAIPVNEIQAGGMVVITDFRTGEITRLSRDKRSQWGSFQLVGVEIDQERNSARLIPAGDRRAFERLLARMSATEGT